MSNLGNITKPLKSIFGLNSGLKSKILELKRERNKNKTRRHIKNLIASQSNTTKIAPNKVSKKTNKSIFDLKNKSIIKDLVELQNKVKNNKIKTTKKDLLKPKKQPKIIKIKTKTAKLRLKNITIMMILNTKEQEI